MCLTTCNKIPKIAERNIYCYKYLTSELLSPFLRFQYEFDKLYINKDQIDFGGFGGFCCIYSGVYHACVKSNIGLKERYKECIAIIPKGSEYWIGVSDDICSKQIIILSKKPNWFKKMLINLGFIKFNT